MTNQGLFIFPGISELRNNVILILCIAMLEITTVIFVTRRRSRGYILVRICNYNTTLCKKYREYVNKKTRVKEVVLIFLLHVGSTVLI